MQRTLDTPKILNALFCFQHHHYAEKSEVGRENFIERRTTVIFKMQFFIGCLCFTLIAGVYIDNTS